jgi:hypothetical protein
MMSNVAVPDAVMPAINCPLLAFNDRQAPGGIIVPDERLATTVLSVPIDTLTETTDGL